MHIICEKKHLQSALDQVSKAISATGNMPILSHVCLEVKGEQLELTTTNLTIGIVTRIPVTVKEVGATTCLFSSISEIVRLLPLGEIGLNLDVRGTLIITTKSSHFELPTLPVSEFPVQDMPDIKYSFEISGKDLADMLRSVNFAAADATSTRTNMQSVLFDLYNDNLVMVSTDGKRMAKISRKLSSDCQENVKAVLPINPVRELIKLLVAEENYRVDICEQKVYFRCENTIFHCGLLDVSYPDYVRFFSNDSDNNKKCSVDRLAFLESLKRVMLMAKDKTNLDLVEFSFQNDYVSMVSNTISLGSAYEQVPVFFQSDEELKIAFNGKYILQVLEALKSEQVELDLKDANSRVMIRPLDSDDYDYICMPLRR